MNVRQTSASHQVQKIDRGSATALRCVEPHTLSRRVDIEISYSEVGLEPVDRLVNVEERIRRFEKAFPKRHFAMSPLHQDFPTVSEDSVSAAISTGAFRVPTQLRREMNSVNGERPRAALVALPIQPSHVLSKNIDLMRPVVSGNVNGQHPFSTVLLDIAHRAAVRLSCHCGTWSAALGVVMATVAQESLPAKAGLMATSASAPLVECHLSELMDGNPTAAVACVPPLITAFTVYCGDSDVTIAWDAADSCRDIAFRQSEPPSHGALTAPLKAGADCILLQCALVQSNVIWALEPVR